MRFRIADTSTDRRTYRTGGKQRAVKTTARDLQHNPANPGSSLHGRHRASDPGSGTWAVKPPWQRQAVSPQSASGPDIAAGRATRLTTDRLRRPASRPRAAAGLQPAPVTPGVVAYRRHGSLLRFCPAAADPRSWFAPYFFWRPGGRPAMP